MSGKNYNIVFDGKIVDGFSTLQVTKGIAEILKIKESNLSEIFSGQKYILKEGLSYQQASLYKENLEKYGALCEIEANSSAKPENTKRMSVMNYLISVSVRTAFFLIPIPINTLLSMLSQKINITIPTIPFMDNLPGLPLGLSILLIGAILGGVVDILFPHSVAGGRIAIKSFNIGTLCWFKGIGLSVSLQLDATGKGVAIKDQKE